MASRTLKAPAFSAVDGTPLSGLTPTWAHYLDTVTGSAITPQPAITEIGTTGKYKTTVTLSQGQSLAGRIDFGTGADPRYYDLDPDYADLLTPATASDVPSAAAIDTQLSGTHGNGTWGGAGGTGSQAVVITATVSGVALPGAFVCAFAGQTLMASGYTDTNGQVSFALNPGTYSIRVTATGYQWTPTNATVSSPNAISPASFDGMGIAPAGTSPVGLSGTATIGAPNVAGSVSELVAGDDYTLTRTIASVPAGQTLAKAWLTVKNAADDLSADAVAILQKAITTTNVAGTGQITDAGSSGSGALRFDLAAADTLKLNAPYDYDIQVLTSGGHICTVERGTISAIAGVTTATS